MGDYFDADMGSIWVQPGGPGTRVYPLLCADTDGFDTPGAEAATSMARVGKTWKSVSRRRGIPGDASLSIETYLGKTKGWLQKQWERNCFFPIYILSGECQIDTFDDYEYGEMSPLISISSKGTSARVRGKESAGGGAADTSLQSWELTGPPLPPEFWKLILNEETTTDAEDEPLRDISVDMKQLCQSGCDVLQDPGTIGTVVADSDGVGAAEGHNTTDNFATTAAWAAQPFAIGEDLASVVEFDMDKDTHRILAACGSAAAAGLRVAYSDDAGATWTVVALNLVATEYVGHGGGLFALDRYHIWLGERSAGAVHFSNDGGATWTDQGAPAPAASEGIMCVNFIDANFGWAVGGHTTPSAHMISTTDGGAHWTLLATEPAAKFITGVQVCDSRVLRVTTADGYVYLSMDWGATWADQTPSQLPDALADVDGMDAYHAVVCGYRTVSGSDYCGVWRTVNGGYTWEEYLAPTALDGSVEYYGANAVVMVDYNQAIAVGEIVDSVASILVVKATEPA